MRVKELPHYWICHLCAEKKGGKIKNLYGVTGTIIKCEYCDEEAQMCIPIVDYKWQFKGTEKFKYFED